MTLTYALIADGGIILAADSQCTISHEVTEGNASRLVAAYQTEVSKIRTLPNGSAFSIAGNAAFVEHLLLKAKECGISGTEEFIPMTIAYGRAFRAEFDALYPDDTMAHPDCEFLFCGYVAGEVPYIVKLSSRCAFSWNSVASNKGYGFSGREEHGAVLYLHHRLYFPDMPMDAARFMAYVILAEVADSDNTVDGPIEMAIVTARGAEPFRDFNRYEAKRQGIISSVRSLILAP